MASNYPLSLFLVAIIGLHSAMGINAEIDPWNIWSRDRSLPTPKQGMGYTFYDDTIGEAHCASFANRLRPLDPRMSKKLVKNLLQICPTVETTKKTALDRKSPEDFDHKYYKNLMKNGGLLTSDEDLFYDARTRELVKVFEDSEFAFFLQFAMSAIKMSQLGVLTGTEGEIRVNCWEPNQIEPIPSPAGARCFLSIFPCT